MLFRRKPAQTKLLPVIRKQIQAQTREQQLQARAYEIWEQRGRQGTPEENWNAAIEALKRERSPIWRTRQLLQLALQVETQSAALDVIKAGIAALGLAATALAGIGLIINYYQGQERLITERFSKSIEQLGSKEMSVRVGGVFALERIARDSPRDHWSVMEVLTAFVRERAPNRQPSTTETSVQSKPINDPLRLPPPPTDVQSALTVIGRRIVVRDSKTEPLNLLGANLQGAFLFEADLQRATLDKADLQGANLNKTNLQRAKLRRANLQGATLYQANLQGAVLNLAKLQGANLGGANLQGVNLNSVKLQGANLDGANLQEATLDASNLQRGSFSKANLQEVNLVKTNLQGAYLGGANLQRAFLLGANLQGAVLKGASLQGAILKGANLIKVNSWNDDQLGAAQLCQTRLPFGSTLNPDRDCKKLRF
jgi:uncharacterized protein YjbI with pentapeptide repeats